VLGMVIIANRSIPIWRRGSRSKNSAGTPITIANEAKKRIPHLNDRVMLEQSWQWQNLLGDLGQGNIPPTSFGNCPV